MGLFTPKWKSNNVETALNAIGKINDPQKLARIIREAPLSEVRFASILKSMNIKGALNLWAEVGLYNWCDIFDRYIIRYINAPESFFISIVLTENVDIRWRARATRKIKTPSALIAIAKKCNEKEISIRRAALEAIKEKELLAAGETNLLLEKQQEQKRKNDEKESARVASEEARRNEGYMDCPECKSSLTYKSYISNYGITGEFGYSCYKCGYKKVVKQDHVSRL